VFGLSSGGGTELARLSELYTYDSNDLGVVMMIGFPLTMLLFTVERGVKRWLLLLNLVGIAAAMARSGSRGGFLGFMTVCFASAFLVKTVTPARRLSLLAAALLVLAVGAPPGYWKQMGTIMSPSEDYNFSSGEGRRELAKRAVGYMASYPVFGLGIGNFGRAECTISTKALTRINGPMKCSAPHNSYLQAGAELGPAGFLIWSGLVIGGIVGPLRLRRRLPRGWRAGSPTERFIYGATTFFPIAMIGFAVTSFFVSFAWLDPIYVMAAFLTGLYVATREYRRDAAALRIAGTTRMPSSEIARRWAVSQGARRFPAMSPT
jgi:O-antigen ligase